MESTFQLDIDTRLDGTNGALVAKQRPFFHRKTHQKSRAGCTACKKRRIKVGMERSLKIHGVGVIGKD